MPGVRGVRCVNGDAIMSPAAPSYGMPMTSDFFHSSSPLQLLLSSSLPHTSCAGKEF